MSRFVSITSFIDASLEVDWAAYRKARVANGNECEKCGEMILSPKGHPDTCAPCKQMLDDGEAVHPRFVRCPKCQKKFDPCKEDYRVVLEEGEHDITCPDCGSDFEVSTSIYYRFTSPPLAKEGGEDESSDEE